MKKLCVSLCLLLSGSFAYSQIMVNNVDVNTAPDVKYIQVTCQVRSTKGKNTCVVYVDYGQRWSVVAESAIGERGKEPTEFDGHMAVMNFLHKNGWELVPYPMNFQTVATQYYIFQKKS